MNSEETRPQRSAANLLQEIAAFVAEKDRLAHRVDELLAANNATEEMRRRTFQELREARATIEAQGKALAALHDQAAVFDALMIDLRQCVDCHGEFFPPDTEPRRRAVQIAGCGIDLYMTLTDPMESIANALKVFEERLGLQSAPSAAVQR
jgi:hypothetical protein